jgi:predicted TIM-barrel fold metal-dependent hydrolase
LQEVAAKLDIPQHHMVQLHTGFLIYNSKRSELTGQMQDTMGQLQQLRKPLTQDQHQQFVQQHHGQLTDMQQQVVDACMRSGSNSSSSSNFNSAALSASHQPAPDMLECMEEADRLLQQLSRQVRSLREASRCLIFHFANSVDLLQMSLAAVHSWPFIMQPPPIIEVLVKQQVAWQQQDTDQDDDDM